MEFIVNNDCFNKAIGEVSKAVSLKTPFPILQGIKITAANDSLTLVGSNSDIVIEKVIPLTINGVQVLKVIETGSAVIPAKYFYDIVRKLPGDIYVKGNAQQLITLQSGEVITKLNGFSGDEYPVLPQIDDSSYIKIGSIQLMELFKQTAFAVAKNESKPVLTGVHLAFKENHLSCAATDSHRLALRELAIDSNVAGSFIVPSSSLTELTKLLTNESGHVQISLSDRYIVFKLDSISLFSRVIEGSYPNVSGLIPDEARTKLTLDRNKLLQGIDRARLFASEWKNNNVHLEIKDGAKLLISSNSSEIGKIEELQTILEITGEPDLNISLDGSFLIDALKAITEAKVRLSFGGSMRPVVIEGDHGDGSSGSSTGRSSYIQLISPVRT
jgi:DNA polymerase III subunit beta